MAQVCGAGAQCNEATLNAVIQAQAANAEVASANMQTAALYGGPAVAVAVLGKEAIIAAALTGSFDYAGDVYSYMTGLSKDSPNFTKSYTAAVIGGLTYPFAIGSKAIAGMSAIGKVAANGHNAVVAGTGAFGAAAVTRQDNPDLAAGVATTTTTMGGWAKAVLLHPLGSLVNQIMQGAAGPIQSAIQSREAK